MAKIKDLHQNAKKRSVKLPITISNITKHYNNITITS